MKEGKILSLMVNTKGFSVHYLSFLVSKRSEILLIHSLHIRRSSSSKNRWVHFSQFSFPCIKESMMLVMMRTIQRASSRVYFASNILELCIGFWSKVLRHFSHLEGYEQNDVEHEVSPNGSASWVNISWTEVRICFCRIQKCDVTWSSWVLTR